MVNWAKPEKGERAGVATGRHPNPGVVALQMAGGVPSAASPNGATSPDRPRLTIPLPLVAGRLVVWTAMEWTPPPNGIAMCQGGGVLNHLTEETSVSDPSIIGIDLAKQSFQLHGAAEDGAVLFRKKLSRGKLHDFLASQPRCLVAMEACGSAHYWGRETLKLGHQVKLVPPIYVKPFVKRQKNDTADAEAIVEAAQRPTMSFVAVKTEAQQASGMLFRTRDLLVRQRTQAINALRGHLAEFGVVAPQGTAHIGRLASVLEDPDSGLPEMVRELGSMLLDQILGLDSKIERLGTELRACAREDAAAARLMTIPGVGPITAMALQAFVPPTVPRPLPGPPSLSRMSSDNRGTVLQTRHFLVMTIRRRGPHTHAGARKPRGTETAILTKGHGTHGTAGDRYAAGGGRATAVRDGTRAGRRCRSYARHAAFSCEGQAPRAPRRPGRGAQGPGSGIRAHPCPCRRAVRAGRRAVRRTHRRDQVTAPKAQRTWRRVGVGPGLPRRDRWFSGRHRGPGSPRLAAALAPAGARVGAPSPSPKVRRPPC